MNDVSVLIERLQELVGDTPVTLTLDKRYWTARVGVFGGTGVTPIAAFNELVSKIITGRETSITKLSDQIEHFENETRYMRVSLERQRAQLEPLLALSREVLDGSKS